jgi:hypothetical protein
VHFELRFQPSQTKISEILKNKKDYKILHLVGWLKLYFSTRVFFVGGIVILLFFFCDDIKSKISFEVKSTPKRVFSRLEIC